MLNRHWSIKKTETDITTEVYKIDILSSSHTVRRGVVVVTDVNETVEQSPRYTESYHGRNIPPTIHSFSGFG